MSITPETTNPIADQVVVLDQNAAAQLPAEVMATFAAERKKLAGGDVPDTVAATGTALPDGPVLDVDGVATTLAEVRAGKPAVLVFYRGAWCPYCNVALRTYQAHLVAELAERGAVLIAISPQKPDGSLDMKQRNELTFAVVSDPGNGIAGGLGILAPASEDVTAAQAALGVDLADLNADGTRAIPMPATVIVDAGGTVRWIDVHPDYSTRSEPAEILAAFDDAIERRA